MNTSSPSHKTTAATDADRHLSHTDYIRIATGDPTILQWCDEIDAEIETLKSKTSPTTVTREVSADDLWDIIGSSWVSYGEHLIGCVYCDGTTDNHDREFPHDHDCILRSIPEAIKARLEYVAELERMTELPSPAPGAGGVPTREEWAAWYDEFLGPCVGSPEALERIRQRRDATNLKFADAILQRLSPSTGLDGVGKDVGTPPHGGSKEGVVK